LDLVEDSKKLNETSIDQEPSKNWYWQEFALTKKIKEDIFCFKVWILWEDHKIWNKIPLILKLLSDVKTKWEIFFKILWFSQNTWTLQLLIYEAFMIWFTLFRIFMHWSNENIRCFRVDRKRTIPLPFDWLKKCGILNSELVKQCHEHFIIVMCLVNYPNQVQIPNGFLKEFFMLSDICGFPWSILELILLHQYFWM